MNTDSNVVLDEHFKNIYGLKWLPWVGSRYSEVKTKLLIVGESHYANGSQENIAEFENPMMTRECVQEMGAEYNIYNVKFYQNIHFTLAGNKEIDTEEFWSRICFHNYVQKIMDDINTRPDWPSFRDSSNQFVSLLEILKPDYCLFCGVAAYGAVSWILEGSDFKKIIDKKEEYKIGNTYPRVIKVQDGDGKETTLIFIKHPSKYYSYDDWGYFIEEEYPEIKSIFEDL